MCLNMKNNHKRQSGFTLVELAISIVIIALLIAIVAAGKNLIQAAKVRAVIKESEELQASFVEFHEKYSELPGDMQNPGAYFPSCAPGCNSIVTLGNELITWDGGAGATIYHEGALAFYELQQAGMLGGEPLSGVNGHAQIGINIPASKLENAGWAVHSSLNQPPHFAGKNALQLGGQQSSGFNAAVNILVPKDAYSIDAKLDDGYPESGRVATGLPANDPCHFTPAGFPTAYNQEETLRICRLRFKLNTEL